jgi:hypothetical protein
MKYIILIALTLNFSFCFSQDTLVKVDGNRLTAKIQKITEQEITYKKWSFVNGPDYSISTNSVYKIIFENGTTEIFNNEVVEKNEIARDPKSAIEKGNNVYIMSENEASKKGEEYFIQNLNEWGYWNVVDNKDLAHFILVLTIEKKGMGKFKVLATFKTLDGQEFKTSEIFKKNVSAFNGYNVARPLCEKLVDNYFKEEFK